MVDVLLCHHPRMRVIQVKPVAVLKDGAVFNWVARIRGP